MEGVGSAEAPGAVALAEGSGEVTGSGEVMPQAEMAASNAGQQTLSGHGKRKMADVEEVGDTDSWAGAGQLQRVSSEVGMVGSVPEGPIDACDSNTDALPPLLLEGPPVINLADQPTDAEMLAWQNQILADGAENQPLIGDREPLDALEAEYAAGSEVFMQKIGKLKESYGSIRRSRGDGNCFYRSFFFSWLEGVITHHDEAERDRLVNRLGELKQALLNAGYEELVFEGPMDMVLQMLRAVDSPVDALTLQGLEGNMRSADIGNYVLFLLRMLTAAEIKSRAEFFAPFILGTADMDVDSFCAKCVDPMGEESDHVQLVALTDTLQVPIRVAYLDRSQAPVGGDGDDKNGVHVAVDMHDFIPDALAQQAQRSSEPRVHLLYRPGHYDIIYPK